MKTERMSNLNKSKYKKLKLLMMQLKDISATRYRKSLKVPSIWKDQKMFVPMHILRRSLKCSIGTTAIHADLQKIVDAAQFAPINVTRDIMSFIQRRVTFSVIVVILEGAFA